MKREGIRKTFFLFFLAVPLVLTIPAQSATKPPAPSITAKPPALTGVLLFHRYSSYDAWDSTLWMLDLKTKKLAEISKGWPVIHAMNAHFSPDGKTITFMGSQSGIHDWDVFISRWSGKRWDNPVNLTGPNGKRDEDPKFAPDGNSIVYKENDAIRTMDLTGKLIKEYTAGKPEGSMPYFLPNGTDLLFESNNAIMKFSHGEIKTLWGGEGLSAYYPIAISNSTFLFTETQSSKCDRVMLASTSTGIASPLFFDSPTWDSSDAYPYQNGARYIFFVSTNRETGFGGYDLALADLKAKKVWNLYTMNKKASSPLEELGPAWSAKAPSPHA